ncbi:MAG: hypothetical protein EP330_22485 [Deltaproteobacteria bacterium]|nr:MAG: hypothetical protein EP330_22485 [Deltaproteobacteria bacterium]
MVTLDHRWHAAEELLWGLFMALLAAVFGASVMRVSGVDLGLVGLGLVATAAGAYVMLVLDVPMYFKRYAEEREKGAPTLAIADGIRDAMTRREPTGSWDVWKHEVAWMTPYFSAGVWLSLGMVWF